MSKSDNKLPVNQILCGSAVTELPKLPTGSVNCTISSPPYWALRDYGWDTCSLFGTLGDYCMPRSAKKRSRWWIMIRVRAHRQGGIFSPNKKTWIGALGLEPTFELYIQHLCSIYDEAKRVLRDDGTCWVNLGDTYASSPAGNKEAKFNGDGAYGRLMERHTQGSTSEVTPKPKKYNVPTKSLCLIPQRFAIEMVNRGWILRNMIIWHKPNPMPSSAKDRFTVDFEYVFFFVKSKRYFFEPQYEAHKNPEYINKEKYGTLGEHNVFSSAEGNRSVKFGTKWSPNERAYNPLGRNKRCVWTIPTQPMPEAHFATYPEKLVEPMILAGCPKEVCKKCGKGREKIYAKSGGTTGKSWHPHKNDIAEGNVKQQTGSEFETYKVDFKGYTDCGCNAGWRPGIVLDPFLWSRNYGCRGRAA